ncbi:unnamed protein product [Ilex paraguariensis]|uniref:Uncharacterized protein n=1 Tax=Ilex paraguariensis TaxID=185542 RepID=A0ABC8RR24_9AQUA
MAKDLHKRETLLPSKLLTYKDVLCQNKNISHHVSRSESSLSGFGSWETSSSGLSTPLGSELGSATDQTESDEDNFIAELTRQMADYMLQEEDEDDDDNKNATPNFVFEKSKSDCNSPSEHQEDQSVTPTPIPAHVQKLSTGFYYNPALADDQTIPKEVYQLENQPFVEHQGSLCWGRRTKITESSQQLGSEQHLQHKEHHHHKQNKGLCHGGRVRSFGSLQVGSGMTAIFLGGPGFKSGSCGTGVFLPRVTNNATNLPRKKSGCPTVLIPARVLQALQCHFNNMDAMAPSKNCSGPDHSPSQHACEEAMGRTGGVHTQRKRQTQPEKQSAPNHQEMQLPPEWTY